MAANNRTGLPVRAPGSQPTLRLSGVVVPVVAGPPYGGHWLGVNGDPWYLMLLLFVAQSVMTASGTLVGDCVIAVAPGLTADQTLLLES